MTERITQLTEWNEKPLGREMTSMITLTPEKKMRTLKFVSMDALMLLSSKSRAWFPLLECGLHSGLTSHNGNDGGGV